MVPDGVYMVPERMIIGILQYLSAIIIGFRWFPMGFHMVPDRMVIPVGILQYLSAIILGSRWF
jgi:hypothetical protein